MRKFLSSATLLLILLMTASLYKSYAQAINIEWQKEFGVPINYESPEDIVVTPSGNTYITGSFRDTMDFDPGPGTTILSPMGGVTWAKDIYVSKFDNNGNMIWVRHIGSKNIDGQNPNIGYNLTLDDRENIYVAGIYGDTLYISPYEPNAVTLTGKTTFVTKFDSSGAVIWAKNLSSGFSEYTTNGETRDMGIVWDKGQYLYVSHDTVITKMDTAGVIAWSRNVGGSVTSLTLDKRNNIYATGSFRDTKDFDPGPSVFALTAPASRRAIFISKLNTAGGFIWAHQLEGSGGASNNKVGKSIAFDGVDGIYITGEFGGQIDCDPGPGVYNLISSLTSGAESPFILKWDTSANFRWAMSILTVDGTTSGRDIFVKGSGVYAAGNFGNFGLGPINFDPNGAGYYLSASDRDGYVLKLDTAGNFQWVHQIGTPGRDVVYAVAVDDWDNVYCAGLYNFSDKFVSKLTCNSFSTLTEVACNSFTFNGHIYNQSGIFKDTIANANGCDSIITINLTLNGHNIDLVEEACDNFSLNEQTYTQTGIFTQTYTNAIGCDSVLNIDLTINTLDLLITNNDGILSVATPNATYQWIDCDAAGNQLITGANARTYAPATNGRYAVIVNLGSCSDTSACYTVEGLDINRPNNVGLFKIYPNPAHHSLSVIPESPFRNARLNVFNVLGVLVMEQKNLNSPAIEVDIKNLPQGVYVAELIQGEQRRMMKFIKD